MQVKIQVKTMKAALVACALFGAAGATASEPMAYEKQNWSWQGIFGTYDRGELQRGLQVYKAVCAVCHSLKYVAFRNLSDLGYSEIEIKAFAKTFEVDNAEPNAEGAMFKRPGRSDDYFPSPFPNDNAARAANNSALPPNLSLIVEARPGGADYLYALLTGYKAAPKAMKLNEGMSYNTAFTGHQIAMPPPLSDGVVEYKDGTKPTIKHWNLGVSSVHFFSSIVEP